MAKASQLFRLPRSTQPKLQGCSSVAGFYSSAFREEPPPFPTLTLSFVPTKIKIKLFPLCMVKGWRFFTGPLPVSPRKRKKISCGVCLLLLLSWPKSTWSALRRPFRLGTGYFGKRALSASERTLTQGLCWAKWFKLRQCHLRERGCTNTKGFSYFMGFQRDACFVCAGVGTRGSTGHGRH